MQYQFIVIVKIIWNTQENKRIPAAVYGQPRSTFCRNPDRIFHAYYFCLSDGRGFIATGLLGGNFRILEIDAAVGNHVVTADVIVHQIGVGLVVQRDDRVLVGDDFIGLHYKLCEFGAV